MISVGSKLRFLLNYKFPPKTTDEEKIIFAYTHGYPVRQIALVFHYGHHKICRVIKHYRETGETPKPINHCPTKLTPEVLASIYSSISSDAHTTLEQMKTNIQQQYNVNISISSVYNGCTQMRYKYKPPQHEQLLTEQQKTNRLSFCNTLLTKYQNSEVDLTSINFSDESRFVLGDDKQWVWRRYGERNPTAVVQQVKFPPYVMIFAAIGKDYKSKLVIVEGSIDSEKYIENIKQSGLIDDLDNTLGRGNWIYMQDGATSHTSKNTVKWLKSRCKFIQGWPANSPDLNPIEHLWAILKAAVYKLKPRSVEELKNVLQTAWDQISIQKINNLVSSFYQRLQLVINKKGESIQPELNNNISKQNIVQMNVPSNTIFMNDVISTLADNLVDDEYYKGPFTKEEDEIILQSFVRYGAKWALIAKKLPKRSRNQVKNRFKEIQKSKINLKII